MINWIYINNKNYKDLLTFEQKIGYQNIISIFSLMLVIGNNKTHNHQELKNNIDKKNN